MIRRSLVRNEGTSVELQYAIALIRINGTTQRAGRIGIEQTTLECP